MGSQWRLMAAVAGVAAGVAGSVQGAWTPTAAGTYDYLQATNWSGGTVDDTFPSTLTLLGAQTLTFGANWTTPGAMTFNYGGNYALTLQGTGGDRTLVLGGNVSLDTAGGSTANVTLGSSTANQRLNVDLGGVERTFTVASGRTLTLLNVVSNGALTKVGAGQLWTYNALTYSGATTVNGGSLVLRGQNSTFTGNISVSGASSTLVIGEQNAISDGCLGNPTNDLSLSNGATLKFGSNNDKAHVLLSPYRDITISGGAKFSTPYGSANVNIPGNIVGSDGLNIGTVTAQLGGNNTFSGTLTYNSSLRISSDANIGGSASTLARGANAGTVGISILGNSLTNLSGHTLTFGTSDGFSIEIQDPSNDFIWDKINNRSMNSGGNPTFVKSGLGTLHVTAAQTYTNTTGIATVLAGGVMKIDYAAGGGLANNAASSRLAFGGGTLHLLGKTDADVTQTLANVRLDAGGGAIVVDNANGSNTTTLNLGDFTTVAAPAVGSSLDIRTIRPGSGSSTVTTTAVNDATGIVGAGRITFNGSSFARNTTGVSGGALGAYTAATAGLGDATVGSSTNYIQAGSPSAAPSAAVYANTLKLTTTNSGQGIDLNGQTLTLTTGGLLFAGADNYTISNGTLKSATATNSDLIVHQYGAGVLTIGSVVANGNGASTLTVAGTGTVVLTSANTYTGQTYVTGATLSISNNNQLNNGANTQLNLYGGALQATETISSGRSVALSGGGGTFDVSSGKTLTLSGVVSGGRLTLDNSDDGNGTLVLGGANTFTSGIVINSGILKLTNNNAMNAQGFNTLSFGSGSTATLQINGARTVTVAGLSAVPTSAVVENGASGAAVLNVYNGADNVFAGTLRDGAAGTLALVKGGGAKLTLSGDSTYTGPTTVAGGILAVNGSITSALTVNGGKLSGTGNVGAVVIAGGGALAAGNSVGTLSASSLTLSAGSLVEVEFNGSSNDRTMVTSSGGLVLSGGAIYLLGENTQTLATLTDGSYHLFGYNGVLGGDLANLSVANDNLTDNVSYAFATSVDAGQNYVDLVVTIPEPMGLGLLGLAVPMLLMRRRIRKVA